MAELPAQNKLKKQANIVSKLKTKTTKMISINRKQGKVFSTKQNKQLTFYV